MGIDISPNSFAISVSEVGNGLASSFAASTNSLFQLGSGAPLAQFLDLAKSPLDQSMNSKFGLAANLTGQVLESFGRQLQQQNNAFGEFALTLNGNKPSFNQEMGEMLNLIGGLVSTLGTMLEQLQGKPQQSFNTVPSFAPPRVKTPNGSGPYSPASMDGDSALRTLTANFDKVANGKRTYNDDDLRKATNGPDKQLAAAAQFMLDNKTFATGVDVANGASRHKREKADGKVSKDDLRTALQSTHAKPLERAGVQALGKEAEQLFAGGDHTVSPSELARIVGQGVMPDGSTASKQMREAANILIHDRSLLERLDVAHAALKHQSLRADGAFGRADLDAVLERMA